MERTNANPGSSVNAPRLRRSKDGRSRIRTAPVGLAVISCGDDGIRTVLLNGTRPQSAGGVDGQLPSPPCQTQPEGRTRPN